MGWKRRCTRMSDWYFAKLNAVRKEHGRERLQPFLKLYQVDKPIMPFFVPDLLKLVKDLLARFIKQDVLDSLATCADVSAFDTSKKDNHCTISLGFSTDKLLRKASDRDILGLRMDAKTVLQTVCKKLVQKTPHQVPIGSSAFVFRSS